MSVIARLPLLCLALSLLGSSEAAPPPESAEPSPSPAAAAKPSEDTGHVPKLLSGIDRIQEKLRKVPGRTGILAEESRYSLFGEELIIRDFFGDRRGGFFLDVGCAWPIRANNTYYLEKHLGWRGVGIDALEDYAGSWARDRPNSTFVHALVDERTRGDATFFKSGEMGLSSAERYRADGRHFGGSLSVEELRIPTTSLDDLLDRLGVVSVDLVALDIEGHELKALRGLDLDRFRPGLIVAEGRRPKIERYMSAQGYEVIERYLPFDPVNTYYQRRVVPAAKASQESTSP